MPQGANVDDIDMFRTMKVGLIKFRQSVEAALINADSQTTRVLHWLEGEQLSYWTSQIRKRQEHVTRCKEAIRAKKLFKDSSGRTPSAFQEEKALQAAINALAHAEVKLANTKSSIPKLQKEIENYRSGVQALGAALVSDIPKAIALLERLSLTLQEYVTLDSQAGTDSGSVTFSPEDSGPIMPPSDQPTEEPQTRQSPPREGADNVNS